MTSKAPTTITRTALPPPANDSESTPGDSLLDFVGFQHPTTIRYQAGDFRVTAELVKVCEDQTATFRIVTCEEVPRGSIFAKKSTIMAGDAVYLERSGDLVGVAMNDIATHDTSRWVSIGEPVPISQTVEKPERKVGETTYDSTRFDPTRFADDDDAVRTLSMIDFTQTLVIDLTDTKKRHLGCLGRAAKVYVASRGLDEKPRDVAAATVLGERDHALSAPVKVGLAYAVRVPAEALPAYATLAEGDEMFLPANAVINVKRLARSVRRGSGGRPSKGIPVLVVCLL